jgi:hypothetical protein
MGRWTQRSALFLRQLPALVEEWFHRVEERLDEAGYLVWWATARKRSKALLLKTFEKTRRGLVDIGKRLWLAVCPHMDTKSERERRGAADKRERRESRRKGMDDQPEVEATPHNYYDDLPKPSRSKRKKRKT